MRFAIIDLNNLFFRSAMGAGQRSDAFTRAGMSLHIIFNSLRRLYRDFSVDHMVFVTEGRSWRNDVFPAYKAARKLARMSQTEREKEDAEILFSTLEDFTNFVAEKTRCTVLNSPGVEGDDFVARWIQLHPEDEHFILSSDSDFVQLLAENVKIIDGIQEHVVSLDGIKNFKGEDVVFHVNPKDGKLKIEGTVKALKKAHDAEQTAKAKQDKTYQKVAYSWAQPSRESEWWREALFIKIIRGDVGDGIFSAYPKVRYAGTAKTTGIREAWEDRNAGGFHWNNFMLQRWQKLCGTDPATGNPIIKETRVLDEFKFNEHLIDLTAQPPHIKDLMDTVIVQAVDKPPVGNVGLHLLRFCAKQDLQNIAKDATDHCKYLNAGYTK